MATNNISETGGVLPARAVSGTLGSGGITGEEYRDGMTTKVVLTLTAVSMTFGDNANLGVGKLIYTLPAGSQIITAAYFSLGFTHAEDTSQTPVIGLGTVIASGAVAVLSGTATFQNIAVGKAATDMAGTAVVQTAGATTANGVVMEVGGTKTVHLNAADAWDNVTTLTGTVTGTVVLYYINLV